MLHPLVKWAQRKDHVLVEIQLRDITDEKIQLKENSMKFQGTSDFNKYSFETQFFGEVVPQESKWTKTGFHIFFFINKNDKSGFWPRLTKNKQKNQYIQVDWNKWIDQDQQQQEGSKGMDGFDPSQMQNFDPSMFQGMGGMGMGMPGMPGMNMGQDQQQGEDLDKQQQVSQDAKKQESAKE